jgi:gliding motility-associated-like protein
LWSIYVIDVLKQIMKQLILTIVLFFGAFTLFAQRGKNLNGILSGTNVINTYTNLTADVVLNATSLTVASNLMTGGPVFGATPLAPGDLILIIQMQGASIDSDNAAMASNNFAYPTEYSWPADWSAAPAQYLYGKVNALNGAGKFQYAEVASISGGTIINVDCPLLTAFSAAGKTQIVRIPRYNDLLLNATAVVNPLTWSGTIGGVVGIEVNGTLTMTAGSKISVSAFGFRGGAVNLTGASTNSNNAVGAVSYYATNNTVGSSVGAGAKGEGIGGSNADYLLSCGNAGRGAVANGGGGGSEHNSGGGGGSNVGNTATWTGRGNSPAGYAAIWDLEFVGMSTATSSGGGRGGYTMASIDAVEASVGPDNAGWGGDKRRVMGGLGGHTLQYSVDRAFLGGGGGAADANNSATATVSQGNGGKGGGIIFLTTYGTVAGTGTFESNGANGSNCQGVAAGIGAKTGVDGAGGAGAGGSIIINNTSALPSTLTLNAIGGNGGSQFASFGSGAVREAQGPGGGGGGGLVAFVSGTPITSVAGGLNGTTNSSIVSGFPPNGATGGGAGLIQAITAYNLTAANVTICSNTTALLTAVYSGTSPGLPSWYTQQFGGASVATGMTFTTPLLSTTTTYYVGFCPGSFRVPVVVTVNSAPIITGPPTITNVSCLGALGSITGLVISGGVAPYTYAWTNGGGSTANVTNGAAGSYTLTASSVGGCSSNAGPFVIGTNAPPVINATGIVLVDQNCLGVIGSISGITATGTGLTYTWDGIASASLNLNPASVGSHTLVVTASNGCTATAGPYVVNAVGGPTVNSVGVLVTNELCNGTLGTITGITASGVGLSYTWNGVASASINLSNAIAGSYTLVVTNGVGCTTSAGPFVIGTMSGPTVNSTGVVVTTSDCLGNLGAISGIIVSGTGLSYSWTNTAQTTLNITGLTQNSYNLTITDNNGCTVNSGPYVVGFVSGPAINTTALTSTNEICGNNNGTISGITTTGTITSTTWNGIAGTLNQTGLTSGNYTLLVTNLIGCTASYGPISITDISGPIINTLSQIVTDETCNLNNGSITGISATGTATLTYQWNGVGSVSLDQINLNSGVYTLIVTDGNLCTATVGPIVIANTALPTIDGSLVVVSPVTCTGNNGSISGLTTTGMGMSYVWNNTSSTLLNPTNLGAGSYSVTGTDINSCIVTAGPFIVNTVTGINLDTSALIIAQTSCVSNTGSINGIVATGTGTLSYLWTNGATTLNISNLPVGIYGLTVTDANGCVSSLTGNVVTAANAPIIDALAQVISSSNCGQANGSIVGTIVSLGTPGYLYSWNSSPVSTSLNLTNVIAGTYILTVTDQNGCSVNGSYIVPNSPGVVINTTNLVVTPADCQNQNGSIAGIMVSGGSSYSYVWTASSQTTIGLNNVASGTYSLTVTDNNGCTAIASIVVGATMIPTAAFNYSPNLPAPNEMVVFTDQSIGANITSWSWNINNTSISSQNPTYIFISEGIYNATLIVTNNFGCVDSVTQVIEVLIEIVIPNILTTNNDGTNDVWKIAGLRPETSVKILNRWGEVVFESNDYKNDWIGIDKSGLMCVDGVYNYIVKTKKGEVFSEFVHLVSK